MIELINLYENFLLCTYVYNLIFPGTLAGKQKHKKSFPALYTTRTWRRGEGAELKSEMEKKEEKTNDPTLVDIKRIALKRKEKN